MIVLRTDDIISWGIMHKVGYQLTIIILPT